MKVKQLRKVLQSITALLCAGVFLSVSVAYAQNFDTNDRKSIVDTTPWYNPYDTDCSTSEGTTPVVGNDNIHKSYNFLKAKGLSPMHAAAIVGNLRQESGSGINPKIVNSIGATGIAQWLGGRLVELKKYGASHGGDHLNLETQLNFLWYEVTEGTEKPMGALPALKKTTSLREAVEVWERKFERAGEHEKYYDKRTKYAQEVLDLYGGASAPTDPNASPVDPTNNSACGNIGNSKFLDGFTLYMQCDPAWGSKSYGSSTICPSGCGPTAMAMIVTALTGQRVTPDVVAAYAGGLGMYVDNVGSKHEIANVVAKKYNLKSKYIGADASKITETLKNGGLVWTCGKGPKPFTSGGHCIVIRGVTADGKWKVGDSAHNGTSEKEWDPNELLSSMRKSSGSVHAITK